MEKKEEDHFDDDDDDVDDDDDDDDDPHIQELLVQKAGCEFVNKWIVESTKDNNIPVVFYIQSGGAAYLAVQYADAKKLDKTSDGKKYDFGSIYGQQWESLKQAEVVSLARLCSSRIDGKPYTPLVHEPSVLGHVFGIGECADPGELQLVCPLVGHVQLEGYDFGTYEKNGIKEPEYFMTIGQNIYQAVHPYINPAMKPHHTDLTIGRCYVNIEEIVSLVEPVRFDTSLWPGPYVLPNNNN